MSDESHDLQRLLRLAEEQHQSIDRLVKVVEELLPKLPPASGGGAAPAEQKKEKEEEKKKEQPINWLELSYEERLELWEELTNFLETLIFRYNMQLEILPCWWKHNDAVEWVTALWTKYKAHFREGSPRSAAWEWQNQLDHARERIGAKFLSCREGHIDTTISKWMSDEARSEFEQAVKDGWPIRE